jgi:hypothetical protein
MQVRYGWGELMAQVREIEEDVAEAGALTPAALTVVARELFRPEHLNLVVVGAWQEEERAAVMAEVDRYAGLWRTAMRAGG